MSFQKQSIAVDCIDANHIYCISIRTKTKTSLATRIKHLWNTKPKLLVFIILLEAISIYGLLFFVPGLNFNQAFSADAQAQEEINPDRLIAMTNTTRNEFNLGALAYHPLLTEAAEQKARYILTHNNFDHSGETGETFSYWIKKTGYDYTRVGENLAINYTGAGDIIEAWMDSPTHRKNILNARYNDIGIATLSGEYNGKETIVVVQLFGSASEQ